MWPRPWAGADAPRGERHDPAGPDRSDRAPARDQRGGPSGLEIQQRLAGHDIDRRRDVVVRDQPDAVDLPVGARVPDPRADPVHVPVLQRAAEPIEAARESHVIAYGDREVAILV